MNQKQIKSKKKLKKMINLLVFCHKIQKKINQKINNNNLKLKNLRLMKTKFNYNKKKFNNLPILYHSLIIINKTKLKILNKILRHSNSRKDHFFQHRILNKIKINQITIVQTNLKVKVQIHF